VVETGTQLLSVDSKVVEINVSGQNLVAQMLDHVLQLLMGHGGSVGAASLPFVLEHTSVVNEVCGLSLVEVAG